MRKEVRLATLKQFHRGPMTGPLPYDSSEIRHDRKPPEEHSHLELANARNSGSTSQEVPSALAAALGQVPYDYAAIALRDSSLVDHLRVRTLVSGLEGGFVAEELRPIAGTPAGWVLDNHQPLLMSAMNPRWLSERLGPSHAEVKSGCWIPLARHGEVMGALFIGYLQEIPSEHDVLDMVLGISAQIANAIEIDEDFRRVLECTEKLREQKRYLEEELRNDRKFDKVNSKSDEIKTALERVETIAPFDMPVMILGEAETGQEWVARSIHQLSSRHDQLFVRLDCTAFSYRHLERKLFGYQKDAVAGAQSRKSGRLELAHMGTLFLEEIGNLPLDLQTRLLSALQEKQVVDLDGRKRIPLDIRLVATTTRDLAAMVRAGEFNSDLYHHLMTFPITLPALRMRTMDIPQLVNHFVTKHARRMNKQIDTISAETMAAFCAADWPGNLRELENFVERAVILSPGSTLIAPLAELEPLHDDTLYAAERRHILRVIRDTKGVIGGPRGAAEKLGLKRTTLNSKLKKLNIERRRNQMKPVSR